MYYLWLQILEINMSRSYKYPIWVDKKDRRSKRLSNKRLRQFLKTISIGFKSSIVKKKVSNPYDICDWTTDPKDEQDKLKAKRK